MLPCDVSSSSGTRASGWSWELVCSSHTCAHKCSLSLSLTRHSLVYDRNSYSPQSGARGVSCAIKAQPLHYALSTAALLPPEAFSLPPPPHLTTATQPQSPPLPLHLPTEGAPSGVQGPYLSPLSPPSRPVASYQNG